MMGWQDFYDWLDVGIANGWVSDPFCSTHDGGPLTDEEAKEWDEGFDPCMPCVRLYGQERLLETPVERHPVL